MDWLQKSKHLADGRSRTACFNLIPKRPLSQVFPIYKLIYSNIFMGFGYHNQDERSRSHLYHKFNKWSSISPLIPILFLKNVGYLLVPKTRNSSSKLTQILKHRIKVQLIELFLNYFKSSVHFDQLQIWFYGGIKIWQWGYC